MGRQGHGARFHQNRPQTHAQECGAQTLQPSLAAGGGDEPAGKCPGGRPGEPKEDGENIEFGEFQIA